MTEKSSSTVKRRRPGRPRADERIPEGSRARVLDAAAEVFARRGYQRATIDEIAREAGLSKGSVYWNFASKEELFGALLEERIDRPLGAVMEMSRDTPQEQPSAGSVDAAVAQLVRDRPQFFQLLLEYWAAAVRDPGLRKQYVARQRRLRAALTEVIRSRQPDDLPFAIPPESLATAFLALGVGLAQEAIVDPDAVAEGLFGDILSLAYDGNAARFGRLPGSDA
jgi:AcrR family transcriptional regulator